MLGRNVTWAWFHYEIYHFHLFYVEIYGEQNRVDFSDIYWWMTLAQLSRWTFLCHVDSERLCYALNLFLRCPDNCLYIGGLTWHNMIWPELWYICPLPSNRFSHLYTVTWEKRQFCVICETFDVYINFLL